MMPVAAGLLLSSIILIALALIVGGIWMGKP